MNKTINFLIVYMAFSPLAVMASPGPVDQYGAHLEGDYHYHSIPQLAPNFYYGGVVKGSVKSTYYMPAVDENVKLTKPDVATEGALIANTALDVSYCNGSQVFATGLYDAKDNVRVAPVCVDLEDNLFAGGVITSFDTYGDIVDIGTVVTKVYHYENDNSGSRVFTDRPEISEFIGKVIQGETDNSMYTVIANDSELKLHAVTAGYAKLLLGTEYQDKIIKFDDSIVYSYPIGAPLN